MIIKQIYNNNVILSENEAGDEIILVGRGIAFGMTRGSKVVEGRIEKKFELQDDVGQKFKTLVQDVPYKTILVSEEIIDYIKTQSTKRINDSIYVTLTDHIANMIERIKMGIVFDPTLLLNVKSLYKEEYRLGLKVTELLRQKLKIDIDDGEASFIALHIINAELDSNMQQMYEITAVIEEILNLVREDFQIDTENGQCDRFIALPLLRPARCQQRISQHQIRLQPQHLSGVRADASAGNRVYRADRAADQGPVRLYRQHR